MAAAPESNLHQIAWGTGELPGIAVGENLSFTACLEPDLDPGALGSS